MSTLNKYQPSILYQHNSSKKIIEVWRWDKRFFSVLKKQYTKGNYPNSMNAEFISNTDLKKHYTKIGKL